MFEGVVVVSWRKMSFGSGGVLVKVGSKEEGVRVVVLGSERVAVVVGD